MSLFINLRAGPYGAVCAPYVLEGDALAFPPGTPPHEAPGMVAVPYESLGARIGGADVLLAAHGFNVDYASGLRSLGRLEAQAGPGPREVVFGVLWPGDWAIPAINYPFEDKVANHAGRLLGDFCNSWLAGAASLSFASHSLGARVILEAVARLKRRARGLCITAGAIGADCLQAKYAAAAANCDTVVTLSSMQDHVLSLAYPIGDFVADLLDRDHKLFERALGRRGPETPFPPQVRPAQIPDAAAYDHGNYLPPGDPREAFPDAGAKWSQATDFIARAFRRQSQPWP